MPTRDSATALYCPSSGAQPGEDSSTHHLVPRGPEKARALVCRYCGKTEPDILAERAMRAGYDIPARLEAIRAAIDAESVSWGELAELQALHAHIPAGDTTLLEWAGVPEHDGDES
jgi:hypothetical protein